MTKWIWIFIATALAQGCSDSNTAFLNQYSSSSDSIWSEGFRIITPRSNPYSLPQSQLDHTIQNGLQHALYYPVEVTGVVIADKPFRALLNGESSWIHHQAATQAARLYTGHQSFADFQDWMGLQRVSDDSSLRMGETRMIRNGVDGMTYSCAVCHSTNLFGKRIVGLTNRHPRANATFVLVEKSLKKFPLTVLSHSTPTTPEELKLLRDFRDDLKFIGHKEPSALGLDTSLAQVALSLAKRDLDPYASKTPDLSPRDQPLDRFVADSKPMPWWTLKYKNRWLSDGSVVSGNPILTNYLWNELGRATDLEELEQWILNNEDVIEEITTAAFASTPPHYQDFFPDHFWDIEQLQRGEFLFRKNCSRCHGQYTKDWIQPNLKDAIRTQEVLYPQQTQVIDVGTDPQRYMGMQYFADRLNQLKISNRFGIRVVPQKGYVPPPLVGIWARWPYFHNNSVPSLCDLLNTRRPVHYYSRPARDPSQDYDAACMGYPRKRYDEAYFFDTRKPGLSNQGHIEGILIRNGKEVLTPQDKKDLIEFLRTL